MAKAGPHDPDMGRVSTVVEAAAQTGTVPGAVALVRHRGEVVLHEAFGAAETGPEPRPMSPDTLFDLASLTKPLVGGALTLALVDRGVVSLDEEVTTFLPELRSLLGHGVTFRRLLSHTSGLPGWRPLYVTGAGQTQLLRAIDDLGLASAPGSRFQYSDIGYITLGLALERVGGSPLQDLATELIFAPCGLHHTTFVPGNPQDEFVATEEGNAFERRMAEWAGLVFEGWRTGFHPGQVNDGNAYYGLGGISGHAGLFSNAQEVGLLGDMWLGGGMGGPGRVLSEAAVDLATSDQVPEGSVRRGLGWELAKRQGPTLDDLTRADAGFFPPTESSFVPWSSGELLSSRSFGHTGFTGSSIWIDPERELVAVLLTNATHPHVDLNKPLNALRARFHNAVASAVGGGASPSESQPK